jgi:hypothetical protein
VLTEEDCDIFEQFRTERQERTRRLIAENIAEAAEERLHT